MCYHCVETPMLRLLCIAFFPGIVAAQWLVGVGPTYQFPENPTYRQVNKPAFGGTVHVLSRQYCHLWYGVRLDYSPLNTLNPLPPQRHGYTDATLLAGELRWFPWLPTDLPLYAAGSLGLSTIVAKPGVDFPTEQAGSSTGVGYTLGIGGLLFYDSHCCRWFLDLSIHYHAPNALLRSKYRPVLSSLQAMITVNYAFGGTQ